MSALKIFAFEIWPLIKERNAFQIWNRNIILTKRCTFSEIIRLRYDSIFLKSPIQMWIQLLTVNTCKYMYRLKEEDCTDTVWTIMWWFYDVLPGSGFISAQLWQNHMNLHWTVPKCSPKIPKDRPHLCSIRPNIDYKVQR